MLALLCPGSDAAEAHLAGAYVGGNVFEWAPVENTRMPFLHH